MNTMALSTRRFNFIQQKDAYWRTENQENTNNEVKLIEEKRSQEKEYEAQRKTHIKEG